MGAGQELDEAAGGGDEDVGRVAEEEGQVLGGRRGAADDELGQDKGRGGGRPLLDLVGEMGQQLGRGGVEGDEVKEDAVDLGGELAGRRHDDGGDVVLLGRLLVAQDPRHDGQQEAERLARARHGLDHDVLVRHEDGQDGGLHGCHARELVRLQVRENPFRERRRQGVPGAGVLLGRLDGRHRVKRRRCAAVRTETTRLRDAIPIHANA